APVVIVVLIVPSAGDRGAAIDQQQLGVHALVELAPAARSGNHVLRIGHPGAAQHRVVQLDVEVAVYTAQGGQGLHVLDRRQLVHQQPHPDPAPRRRQQLVQYQPAGIVVLVDVGLQVDAGGGTADQVDPRQQRI